MYFFPKYASSCRPKAEPGVPTSVAQFVQSDRTTNERMIGSVVASLDDGFGCRSAVRDQHPRLHYPSGGSALQEDRDEAYGPCSKAVRCRTPVQIGQSNDFRCAKSTGRPNSTVKSMPEASREAQIGPSKALRSRPKTKESNTERASFQSTCSSLALCDSNGAVEQTKFERCCLRI